MKNRDSLIYWISTGLFAAFILLGAGNYFLKTEVFREVFESFGYPRYLVIGLGVAKFLGVIAIVTRRSRFLEGLAYAGFFYNLTLAFVAHINAGDNEFVGPIIGLVLLSVSYIMSRRVKGLAPDNPTISL